ncbi:hypothetical protein [Streptomyces sp. G-G2]|uniref:hypothetical protein n=1 Tax=Streptomyces sp. G-G2 TaxID=3046201 RepID=UPI0024BB1063|nr:hypothetical protein [Streptomyces sp. G-G2]MDJ0382831.1 hypothetical protein [Streptomyces sp. G-G2]
MPPEAPGTPRWDPQAQRWVWDDPGPPPGQSPAPAAPPAQGVYGPPPTLPPEYPPTRAEDAGSGWPPSGPTQQLPVQPPPLSYPPPPPPEFQPGPPGAPPGGGSRRWLTPATAGIAVAAVAIGAAAVWFMLRDSGGAAPDQAHGTSTPSVSTSGSPGPRTSGTSSSPRASASDLVSPSASASGPAAGYTTLTDPKGFTIAVPKGWIRDDPGNGVFYRTADRSSLLQIFRVVEPELSPLDAVQGASADLRQRTTGYTEIRVGAVPGGSGACELVYEYDSAESHGRRRGVERVFVAQDGLKWALLAAGPAADADTTRANLAAAVQAFHP